MRRVLEAAPSFSVRRSKIMEISIMLDKLIDGMWVSLLIFGTTLIFSLPLGLLIIPKTAHRSAVKMATAKRKYPHMRLMLIAASEPPVAIA